MAFRKTALRVLALGLVGGAVLACSRPRAEAPAPLPDVRGSVATLGIPACDEYVSAIEAECFGSPSHRFPAGLVGLVEDRVDGWQRDAREPGGRARVAERCASARDAVQTFHCDIR